MDDSPVPRHLFESQEEYDRVVAMSKQDRINYMNAFLGKCDAAIHIPGQNFEVGVTKVGDSYQLVWDWASSLSQVMGSGGATNDIKGYYAKHNPLLQEYAAAKIELEAEQRGYVWTRTKLDDGRYQIEVTGY